jgi:hypothetical protein
MASIPIRVGKVDHGLAHIAGIGLIWHAEGPKQCLGGRTAQTVITRCIVPINCPLYLILCKNHQDKIKSADISETGVARLS